MNYTDVIPLSNLYLNLSLYVALHFLETFVQNFLRTHSHHRYVKHLPIQSLKGYSLAWLDNLIILRKIADYWNFLALSFSFNCNNLLASLNNFSIFGFDIFTVTSEDASFIIFLFHLDLLFFVQFPLFVARKLQIFFTNFVKRSSAGRASILNFRPRLNTCAAEEMATENLSLGGTDFLPANLAAVRVLFPDLNLSHQFCYHSFLSRSDCLLLFRNFFSLPLPWILCNYCLFLLVPGP
jgi:hypothetical protein